MYENRAFIIKAVIHNHTISIPFLPFIIRQIPKKSRNVSVFIPDNGSHMPGKHNHISPFKITCGDRRYAPLLIAPSLPTILPHDESATPPHSPS
jgi:hypothetical protein